jgi:hypothetical protein
LILVAAFAASLRTVILKLHLNETVMRRQHGKFVRQSREGARRMNTRIISIVIPALAGGLVTSLPANAQQPLGNYAGDLIISSRTYTDPGFSAGTPLPFNASGTGTTSTLNTSTGSAFCANANCSVNVWNNDAADANFGITAGIFLQDVNASSGAVDNTVNVTQIAANEGINLVTSFQSICRPTEAH